MSPLARAFSTRRATGVDRADHGFSLLEVMVALMVLLIALVPMGYLIDSVTQVAAQTRERVAATGVADQWISHLNTLALDSYPSVPGTYLAPDVTVAGTVYHTSVNLAWAEAGLSGNLCTPGATPQVISAVATVSWGKETNPTTHSYANSISTTSVLNPPYGALSTTDGYLAIQVDNALGNGLTYDSNQGAVIATFSPSPFPDGHTQVTVPQGGCLFLPAPQGTYSVVLSSSGWPSPNTYVDNTAENPTPSSTTPLVVSPGTTTSYEFLYDHGGAINLAYASQTDLADGFACPTSGPCFAWGRERGGADLVAVQDGKAAMVPVPNGIQAINGVSCLPNGTCVLVGSGSGGGVVLSYHDGSLTTISTPVPSTDLTGVACSNGSNCYVVGTDGPNAPVLLDVAGSSATSELPASLTTKVASLTSVTCSSANLCFASGSGTTTSTSATGTTSTSATGIILDTTSGSGSWATQAVPPTTTDVADVACDAVNGSSPPLCVASASVGGSLTALWTTNQGTTWTTASSFPPGIAATGPVACVDASDCLMVVSTVSSGTESSTVAATSDGGQSWSSVATLASSFATVTSLTCSSSTSCLLSGSGPGGGVEATGTLAGGAWSWAFPSLNASVEFLSGVGCSTSTACDAVGESNQGPVVFASSDGGGSWSQDAGLTSSVAWDGATATGLPITVSASGLSATGTYTASGAPTYQAAPYTSASTPDPPQVGNLFPFNYFYNLWAGDASCQAEVPTFTLPTVQVPPGGTTSSTVPLGFLRTTVLSNSGAPLSGVALSLTVTSNGCANDTFDLPTTGADGTSEAGVPVGNGLTFTLTATDAAAGATATETISVGTTGVTDGANNVTYPFPAAVPITLASVP